LSRTVIAFTSSTPAARSSSRRTPTDPEARRRSHAASQRPAEGDIMNGTLTDVFAAIGLSVTCVAVGFPIGWALASLWIRLRPQR
jgi:hypothetical protein